MYSANTDHGWSSAHTPGSRGYRTTGGALPRGFTLIELLVVVSIIALLISILIPSLSKARAQARTVKCLAHQRGLAQAGFVFTGDHNGRFQLAAIEGDQIRGVNAVDPSRRKFEYDRNQELIAWPVAMAQAAGVKYNNNSEWGVRSSLGGTTAFSEAYDKRSQMSDQFEAAQCPADKVRVSTPYFPFGEGIKGPGAQSGQTYWGFLSFGINEDIVGTEFHVKEGKPHAACWKNGVQGESTRPDWEQAGLRLRGNLDRVYQPQSCLLVTDSGPNTLDEAMSGEFTVESSGLGYANVITSAQARGPYLEDSVYRWVQRIPTKRHPRGAINVTFADFHAKAIRPVGWRTVLGNRVPARYSDRVRVSPYKPFVE